VYLGSAGVGLMEQLLTPAGPPWEGFTHQLSGEGVQVQQWTLVEFYADYVGHRVGMSINGLPVLDVAMAVDCPLLEGEATLAVGLHCVPADAPASHFHADDVVFDPRFTPP